MATDGLLLATVVGGLVLFIIIAIYLYVYFETKHTQKLLEAQIMRLRGAAQQPGSDVLLSNQWTTSPKQLTHEAKR